MIVTVSHEETVFNRATRKKDAREVVEGRFHVSWQVEKAMRELAPKYRMSVAELVVLCLQYYFGDGKDHLGCEYCALFGKEWSQELQACVLDGLQGENTLPLLDKGSVVVGQPSVDLGK